MTSKWESLANWLVKIDKEADRMNWDGLRDMACEAYDAVDNLSEEEIFFGPFRFLWRLYERASKMDGPEEFGVVRIEEDYKKGRYIVFQNYTYKQFIWANKNKFIERIDNKYISVLESEMPKGMMEKFIKKKENEGKNEDKDDET